MNEIQLTIMDRQAKRFLAAAMAMQGFLADPRLDATTKDFARFSVEMADALLAELEKTL